MDRSSNTAGDQHVPSRSTAVFMFGTIADTSWRLFLPIVGLMLLGLLGDVQIHTKPWLMLSGLFIGVIIAVLLIRQQLKRRV